MCILLLVRLLFWRPQLDAGHAIAIQRALILQHLAYTMQPNFRWLHTHTWARFTIFKSFEERKRKRRLRRETTTHIKGISPFHGALRLHGSSPLQSDFAALSERSVFGHINMAKIQEANSCSKRLPNLRNSSGG